MSCRRLVIAAALLCLLGSYRAHAQDSTSLGLITTDGKPFPLRLTTFDVTVTGGVSQVTVRQVFRNPCNVPLEAIYSFPLPDEAAVRGLTMVMGNRRIEGAIKKKEEATKTYELAKKRGETTALLTQKRPNIFVQHLANLLPSEEIVVELCYLEDLRFEKGRYTLVVPMTVGARFNPPEDSPEEELGSTCGYGEIPPVLSDLKTQVSVALPHGTEPEDVLCNHQILREHNQTPLTLHLAPTHHQSNEDFVLSWKVAKEQIAAKLTTHRSSDEGTFALHLTPPQSTIETQAIPRCVYVVMDCSGSMSGQPFSAAQAVASETLRQLRPFDTFQILRFAQSASEMSNEPLPATPANIQKGLRYVSKLRAGGGTMMLNGIRASLAGPRDPGRMRVVHFMTDGYIGNETQIFDAIRTNLQGARIFPLGVGSSPNRYLINRLARVGRGAASFVPIKADTAKIKAIAQTFAQRVHSPCLTDIQLHWDGLSVHSSAPASIPDLFSSQPIVVQGRYRQSGSGTLRITGNLGAGCFETSLPVTLPEIQLENELLPILWARQRIQELMIDQGAEEQPAIRQKITELALNHQLMSRYTAFVAVDHMYATGGGEPRRIIQSTPIPKGMRSRPFDATQSNDAIGLGSGGGNAFGGRAGGRRNLRASGGGGRTSNPVDHALKWLASQQNKEGHWGGTELKTSAQPNANDRKISIASLTLLAYLGANNTHRNGPYKSEVRKGLKWLRTQRTSSGWIGTGAHEGRFTDHALGTLALSEAYGMTKSGIWKGTAQLAVGALTRYLAKTSPSPTLTLTERAIALSALVSARRSGLTTKPTSFTYLHQSLKGENPKTFEELAAAALIRTLAGETPTTSPNLHKHLEGLISIAQADPKRNPLAWHFSTISCFQAGGNYWIRWNRLIKDSTLADREKAEAAKATWPAAKDFFGGQVGTTAALELTIEMYYRYGRVFGAHLPK